MLTIVRGVRNVQAAQESRNRSSSSKPAGRQSGSGSRLQVLQVFPGQVGVAVRRDDNSLPLTSSRTRYGESFVGWMGQLDRLSRCWELALKRDLIFECD